MSDDGFVEPAPEPAPAPPRSVVEETSRPGPEPEPETAPGPRPGVPEVGRTVPVPALPPEPVAGEASSDPVAGLRRLAPAVVVVWTVGIVLFWGVVTLLLGVGVLIALLAGGTTTALVLGTATLAAALVGGLGGWLHPRAQYRHWGYQLSPDGLVLQHGVWWRTRSVIPYVRVQHVDVGQGPVERRLGLAHLQVHTAAAATDSTIPGVAVAEAESLRRALLARVGDDDAV